jgi:hypothetical protein
MFKRNIGRQPGEGFVFCILGHWQLREAKEFLFKLCGVA